MAMDTIGSRRGIPQKAWAKLLDLLEGETGSPGSGYERLRARLVDFFRWKGCMEAEELADATFDRVAKRLVDGEKIQSDQPARYVMGVARLVYLESVKKDVRRKKALADGLGSPEASGGEEERRLQALQDCLDTIGESARANLLVYHRGRGQARIDARQELAVKQGITLNTLRIRMHRLRESLADCVRGKIS